MVLLHGLLSRNRTYMKTAILGKNLGASILEIHQHFLTSSSLFKIFTIITSEPSACLKTEENKTWITVCLFKSVQSRMAPLYLSDLKLCHLLTSTCQNIDIFYSVN